MRGVGAGSHWLVLGWAATLSTQLAQAEGVSAFGDRTTAPIAGAVSSRDGGILEDGAYGRFDGDLDLGVGLGAELDQGGQRGVLSTSARYFATFGLSAALGTDLTAANPELETVFSLRAELTPLFLPRFALNWERGPRLLDLTLDSLSFSLGPYWASPQGRSFGTERGLEAGVGLGLPLMLQASGLWLHGKGLFRFPDAAREGRSGALLLMLSWHGFVVSPIAEAAP